MVLLAYARLTGQNVKRAAVGAEGPVLDHYSAAAVEAHLRAVGDPMLDAVPAELVGSVFCDSLEVYGADWTTSCRPSSPAGGATTSFRLLYRLTVDGPDAARVRADYHRTLAELYEENFVAGCQRWAAGRGVPFRIQCYGTPPATISSYRFADLFEGEGWGWRKITQTRWASSAAHLYGRHVVSAEVWTWVHSPSFRATPLDLKGEAHEHLLNGINQLDRSRLALLADRCTRTGLVLLCRRCARRPQPVVAGDAGAHQVPEQAVLAAAAGRAGGRRRALRAQRGPVRDHGPSAGRLA